MEPPSSAIAPLEAWSMSMSSTPDVLASSISSAGPASLPRRAAQCGCSACCLPCCRHGPHCAAAHTDVTSATMAHASMPCATAPSACGVLSLGQQGNVSLGQGGDLAFRVSLSKRWSLHALAAGTRWGLHRPLIELSVGSMWLAWPAVKYELAHHSHRHAAHTFGVQEALVL